MYNSLYTAHNLIHDSHPRGPLHEIPAVYNFMRFPGQQKSDNFLAGAKHVAAPHWL